MRTKTGDDLWSLVMLEEGGVIIVRFKLLVVKVYMEESNWPRLFNKKGNFQETLGGLSNILLKSLALD